MNRSPSGLLVVVQTAPRPDQPGTPKSRLLSPERTIATVMLWLQYRTHPRGLALMPNDVSGRETKTVSVKGSTVFSSIDTKANTDNLYFT